MLAGAIGVVVARNPVHSALMLVMTLFGVAVLFVQQRDPFLAAVQVIVYAGAIVVLFLFVIMFLGRRPRGEHRRRAAAGPAPAGRRAWSSSALAGLLLLGQVSQLDHRGAPTWPGVDAGPAVQRLPLGKSVYTTYLFPFEVTAALLVIAVVGAVVLARRPPAAANPMDDADRRPSRPRPVTTAPRSTAPVSRRPRPPAIGHRARRTGDQDVDGGGTR